MTEDSIRSIIDDIIKSHPDAKGQEADLRALARVLVDAKPDVLMDPRFVANLKERLLQSTQEKKKDVFSWISFPRVAAISVALFLLFFIPNFFLNRDDGGEVALFTGAKIAYTQGDVSWAGEDYSWKSAQEADMLFVGARVRTGEASRAEIALPDGSVLRLDEQTTIFLETLDDDFVRVENENGDVYARVAKQDGRVFEIVAEGRAYRALGTAYRVVNTKEKKGLVVYESSVAFVSVSEEDVVAVEEGESYYIVDVEGRDVVNQVVPIDLTQMRKDEFVVWNAERDGEDPVFREHLGVFEKEDSEETSRDLPVQEEEKQGEELNVVGSSREVISPDVDTTLDDVQNDEVPEVVPPEEQEDPVFTDRANIFLWESRKSNEIGWSFWSKRRVLPNAYKVIWSKQEHPSYPPRRMDHVLSIEGRKTYTATLSSFDGSGIYFVRVCAFVNNVCEVFSNEIRMRLR